MQYRISSITNNYSRIFTVTVEQEIIYPLFVMRHAQYKIMLPCCHKSVFKYVVFINHYILYLGLRLVRFIISVGNQIPENLIGQSLMQ